MRQREVFVVKARKDWGVSRTFKYVERRSPHRNAEYGELIATQNKKPVDMKKIDAIISLKL